MGTPLPEKRKLVEMWLEMTSEQRFERGLPLDRVKLARQLGVKHNTISDWEKRHWANKLGENLEKAGEEPIKEEFDSQNWLNETRRERYEAALRAAKAGNAQAMKLLHQLAEELVEKQEVIHKIDGGDIARAIFRARREREEDSRMDTVSGEFSALPEPLRLSTRPGKRKNRKVGKLVAST